ncbi:hypothetical protein ACQP25_35990 [Microtetraspora malaysiensis]|uniref:hypothetical protein n=1 Tax=Microtetraspora malaysiensis TaxID=161358 RepID=UPI003D8F68E7
MRGKIAREVCAIGEFLSDVVRAVRAADRRDRPQAACPAAERAQDREAARSAAALTPEQVASPLAARPFDLRHAAVSLWLNAGVHAPEAAERAGHGIDVMLRVYAKCIDGQREIANRRIDSALAS